MRRSCRLPSRASPCLAAAVVAPSLRHVLRSQWPVAVTSSSVLPSASRSGAGCLLLSAGQWFLVDVLPALRGAGEPSRVLAQRSGAWQASPARPQWSDECGERLHTLPGASLSGAGCILLSLGSGFLMDVLLVLRGVGEPSRALAQQWQRFARHHYLVPRTSTSVSRRIAPRLCGALGHGVFLMLG